MARIKGLFGELELVDEFVWSGTGTFTLGYLCSCILEGCRPKETLPESFAGKCSCANVVATYASVYLRQQLLSFFPGNALQFHSVESSSVQYVIDKLVHT